MEIRVKQQKSAPTRGRLTWAPRRGSPRTVDCALGRGGIRQNKTEGDGATPVGRFVLRRLFFRADRRPVPQSALPLTTITPHLGWCDDPKSPAYNRLVRLPCPWGHEVLWRDDALYDLMVVLGHNDAPPVPGLGSAIFLHLAADGYAATEGCVALDEADMLALLKTAGPDDWLTVNAPA